MLARVQSYVLQGIDALPCEVEVDFDHGGMGGGESDKPRTTTVGLPDTAVKESIERVRAAMTNSGFVPHRGTVLINLAPADIRKEGPLYDLPIAVGLLTTQGVIGGQGVRVAVQDARSRRGLASVGKQAVEPVVPGGAKKPFDPFVEPATTPALSLDNGTGGDIEPLDHRQFLFAGELALDGRLRPVRGVIAMAALAKSRGLRGVIVPAENAAEAAVVPGVEAIGAATLIEVIGYLNGTLEARPHPAADVESMLAASTATVDFVDVRGQEAVKRAIVVACAGSHNLFGFGPSVRHGGVGIAGARLLYTRRVAA